MFGKVKGKLIAVLVMMFVVLSFSGCAQKSASVGAAGSDSQKAESTLDKIKKSGKLVLGTSADYPPYEFHKVVNGNDEIVGFDIEIAKEIAKELGVKLEIKDMKFDGLLAALDTGNVDLVIAGMNPTEERKKSVDFSKVYYQAEQAVMVRVENKDKYKDLKELSGKKVGVQRGTTQEQVATDEIPGAQIKALGKVTDLVLQLQNKMVDAIVVEHPVAAAYASKNKDIVVTNLQFNNKAKGAAAAIKKGNPELVEVVNKALDRMINDKSIEKFVVEANNISE